MLYNLIRRIKNKILGRKKVNVTKNKYPFQFSNEVYPVTFEINNAIEEFRLAKWGGEKEYVVELVKDLKENDVLYDIGSSVGLISVVSACVLKRGKVVSFEPDPENLAKLEKNYLINGFKNYIPKPIAVGEKKDKLRLFTQGSDGYSPSLQQVNGIERFIEVEVESIDNLLARKEIPYPDVVKIDIEGAEFMALKGMKELLASSNRPRLIFLELHPKFLPAFNCTVDDIYQFLKGFNYSIVENIEREDQILCKLVANR